MSLLYQVVHLIHLLLAASWTGAIVASDYLLWTLDRSEDRLERARTIRKLLIGLEMPLAVLVPLLGLAMTGITPLLWRQGWLHMKVTAVVFLLLLLVLGARRNRLLIRALQSGDDAQAVSQTGVYRLLRMIGWAALLVIFFAVVFRFGEPPAR